MKNYFNFSMTGVCSLQEDRYHDNASPYYRSTSPKTISWVPIIVTTSANI
jgi:hypothetical protein